MILPGAFIELKGQRKITMLTCYDYPTAKILAKAGIDILLVGDSLGMVVLGYPDTKSVTLQDIVRHTAAVVRGCGAVTREQQPLVVADMPLHTTDTAGTALRNCQYVLEKTGAHAVKIEGHPRMVKVLTEAGIAVMGHTGLKPQFAEAYKVYGKNQAEADIVRQEALNLESAGAFAVVLECIPAKLAAPITLSLKIPTIGIGASHACDGQVLVISDLIGLYDNLKPKFVRQYAHVSEIIAAAVENYRKDVEDGTFPNQSESY